ncbi:thioredoxin family protein [Pseudoalteromonas marina]|uniref:thioredoxin family protein n=1 Tax=Pseudoalteromonas marina TaxID=267375 RepID=UPI003AFF9C81
MTIPKAMKSKKTTIVYAYTKWSNPCTLMSPIIESLAKRNINIIMLDTDSEPETASKLKVKAVPALLQVSDGRVLKSLKGAHNLKDCIGFCEGTTKN